jgi:hypothetical protein
VGHLCPAWFANTLEDFCIYIHQGTWSVTFVFGVSLPGFGSIAILAFWNEFGSILSLL